MNTFQPYRVPVAYLVLRVQIANPQSYQTKLSIYGSVPNRVWELRH